VIWVLSILSVLSYSRLFLFCFAFRSRTPFQKKITFSSTLGCPAGAAPSSPLSSNAAPRSKPHSHSLPKGPPWAVKCILVGWMDGWLWWWYRLKSFLFLASLAVIEAGLFGPGNHKTQWYSLGKQKKRNCSNETRVSDLRWLMRPFVVTAPLNFILVRHQLTDPGRPQIVHV